MHSIFVFAGGPSLNRVDTRPFMHKGFSIGVNDSALRLNTDIFFTMDRLWFENTAKDLKGRSGIVRHSVYDSSIKKGLIWPQVKRYEMHYDKTNLNLYSDVVHGNNSGFCAFNYAVLMCLKEPYPRNIFLFGFDFQGQDGKAHWYPQYSWVQNNKDGSHYRKWAKDMDNTKSDILKLGINVYNCSDHSLVKAFPVVSDKEVLSLCL